MINSVYIQAATLDQLRNHYHSDPQFKSVSLAQFLDNTGMEQLLKDTIEMDFREDHQPLSHRQSKASIPSRISDLTSDSRFQDIVTRITGSWEPLSDQQLLKFGHTDYQIINDESVLPPGMDVILDLTPQWHEQMGGYLAYTDGQGTLYTIPPNLGTLTLVDRSVRYHRYVKYVNINAGKLSRYLFIGNTVVEP